MLWLAAAAVTIAAPAQSSGAARPVVAEARATVRIISGVRLKLDSTTNSDAPPAHDSIVITNGTEQPARLIEFQ
jgi:hypothetical protein